ncbi:MAG TPA: hypothetical protein VE959_08980 [Bryobacteraceae bacterium]|nr:hypothetical protein [Bryobacteraceae bacterium]
MEFLEELLVRRELAFNFVRYAKRVARIRAIRCIPENSSKAPRRAMIYGMPLRRNCCSVAKSTAITGCTGGKKIVESSVAAYLREIDQLERTGKELTT